MSHLKLYQCVILKFLDTALKISSNTNRNTDCRKWYFVVSGDTCNLIENKTGVSAGDLGSVMRGLIQGVRICFWGIVVHSAI
jgi:hypothetical protein